MTSAFKSAYWLKPAVTSHNSEVHTPVNANGKNRMTVFFPLLLLRETSETPSLFLDFNTKSGAFVPTEIAMSIQILFGLIAKCVCIYTWRVSKCQTAIRLRNVCSDADLNGGEENGGSWA